MADVAARRREARRRKLLMSSEDRLNKILQLNTRTKGDQESDFEKADIPQEESRNESPEHTRVIQHILTGDEEPTPIQPSAISISQEHQTSGKYGTSKEVINKTSFPCKTSAEPPPDETAPASTREVSSDASIVKEQSSSESTLQSGVTKTNLAQNDPSKNVRTHSAEHEVKESSPILTRRTYLRTSDSEGASIIKGPSHGGESSQQSMQESGMSSPRPGEHTFEAETRQKTRKGQRIAGREVGCVLLAVAMHCILTCDWLAKYTGQSIIMPFLALQLMLAVLSSKQIKPDGGILLSSLSMALMLCSVPQETISTVTRVLAIFIRVFADLALYLFTFIILHCVLEVFG